MDWHALYENAFFALVFIAAAILTFDVVGWLDRRAPMNTFTKAFSYGLVYTVMVPAVGYTCAYAITGLYGLTH